jgi:hypothetical protein
MFFITFTEYSFAHYKTLVISGGWIHAER